MTDPMPFGTEPGPEPIVKPKAATGGRSGNLSNLVFALAAMVAIGGVSFAVGRATAPAAAAAFDPTTGGQPGGFGDRAMTVTGTVKSLDGSTLTITTAAGAETVIDVSGSTYHAEAGATAADVTAGATVSVSVTGFGGMGRPGGAADPAASPAATASTLTATDVTITAK